MEQRRRRYSVTCQMLIDAQAFTLVRRYQNVKFLPQQARAPRTIMSNQFALKFPDTLAIRVLCYLTQ